MHMGLEQLPAASAAVEPAEPLLGIGVFARRSRLSTKALRLYDRMGVLTPAQVDDETGYRRYRESQLATARLVALLRRLDMPLTKVSEVLAASGPEGAELLAEYWEAVERRTASQRELVAHVRIRLLGEEGSFEMYDVRERDVPEQLVLTEQRHVLVPELPGWLQAAIGRLLQSAESHGGLAGDVFVIYHGEVNEDSDGPVEVCVPVRPGTEAAADAAVRSEPAYREAYVRITKAQVEFPQILSAYDAVAHWIGSQGLEIGGSPREVYFTDFASAAPTDEVCDIAFPLH
jgi:DNA-binding transcriptional MerR regulator